MKRRGLALILAIVLAVGFALCRQLGLLAAPGRQAHAKENAILWRDDRLIRKNEEAIQLRRQVDAARKKAFENGYHACCMMPPCSWCLLHLGQCTCAQGVGSGRYACRECHGGWEANQGRIPGRTRDEVRKMKTVATDFAGEQAEPTTHEPGR